MDLLRELDRRAGSNASRNRIVVFALTLGLVSADAASIGAVAPELKTALHIGNGQLGVLGAATTVAGAAAAIPAGVLVDRMTRTRLLAFSAMTWALATAACAPAWSFATLLITRLVRRPGLRRRPHLPARHARCIDRSGAAPFPPKPEFEPC